MICRVEQCNEEDSTSNDCPAVHRARIFSIFLPSGRDILSHLPEFLVLEHSVVYAIKNHADPNENYIDLKATISASNMKLRVFA